jgi:hypothetical protein
MGTKTQGRSRGYAILAAVLQTDWRLLAQLDPWFSTNTAWARQSSRLVQRARNLACRMAFDRN